MEVPISLTKALWAMIHIRNTSKVQMIQGQHSCFDHVETGTNEVAYWLR